MTKSFTLQEISDAIRKNGKPQGFGAYHFPDGTACAIGQGADNLQIVAFQLNRLWYGRILPKYPDAPDILTLNDTFRYTLPQIADKIDFWIALHSIEEEIFEVDNTI